jgi:hypothetical protein
MGDLRLQPLAEVSVFRFKKRPAANVVCSETFAVNAVCISTITELANPFERKTPTAADREGRKAFKQVEAEKAMTDHQKTQKAFHGNRERLKAARLAREAESNRRNSRR